MYKYKETKYKTLSELARALCINKATLRYRLNKGMSLNEACSRKIRSPNPITIKGKMYRSLNQACVKYSLCYDTVRDRLGKGWSVEESFGLVKRKSCTECKGKVYKVTNSVNKKVYIGITIGSLKSRFNSHKYHARTKNKTKFQQAMNRVGIDKFTIHLLKETTDRHKLHRLELKYINEYNSIQKGYNTALAGCSLEDRQGNPIDYKGLKFISIKALADYLNIPSYLIKTRLKAGIPLDKPVGDDRIKNIKYKGKVYNRKELANLLGLTVEVVKHRLKNDIPLDKSRGSLCEDASKKFKYEGKHYTIKQLALKLGITDSAVRNRINKNIPLCQKIGIKPKNRKGKQVQYEGKIYSNSKRLAEYLKVTPATICYKIKKGEVTYLTTP